MALSAEEDNVLQTLVDEYASDPGAILHSLRSGNPDQGKGAILALAQLMHDRGDTEIQIRQALVPFANGSTDALDNRIEQFLEYRRN